MSIDVKNNIDDDIPEWHIPILKERLKNMEEGKAVFYNWEDVNDSIFKVENTNGKSTQD